MVARPLGWVHFTSDPATYPPAMKLRPSTTDQTITLAVLAVLVVGVFLVLQPFISAIVWAAILAATVWPVFAWMRRRLAGRSGLAATIVTLLILLVVVTPFLVVGVTLAENSDRVMAFIRGLVESGPPGPPAWVNDVPFVGPRIVTYWSTFAHDSAATFVEFKKWVEPAKAYALKGGAGVAEGLLQLTLSVLIAFFFFRDGDAIVARLRGAVSRIAPERGLHMLQVALATTRAVVYGILGTALAQGVLMAIGLWIAGFKAAPLLGLVTFFLSPVPVGPPLVWIPASVLLFMSGSHGWGVFLFLWGMLVVSSVDNLIKPLIISYGSHLPFILVLLGVFGGVIAFGLIGVFLGPVLLALGFAMIKEWAGAAPAAPASETEAHAER
jgi:predicted PurR-regulated permease PerM